MDPRALQFICAVAERAKQESRPYSDPKCDLMSCLAWYADAAHRYDYVKSLLEGFLVDVKDAELVAQRCLLGSGFGLFPETVKEFPPGSTDHGRLKLFGDEVYQTFSRKLCVVLVPAYNMLTIRQTNYTEKSLDPEFEAFMCDCYRHAYELKILPLREPCAKLCAASRKQDVKEMQHWSYQMLLKMDEIGHFSDIPTFWKENVVKHALASPKWNESVVKFFKTS